MNAMETGADAAAKPDEDTVVAKEILVGLTILALAAGLWLLVGAL